MAAIAKDKTDELFSFLVRERADFTCEYCDTEMRHAPDLVDCSHLFSRGNKSTRWQPLGSFCHCRYCHGYLERNPNAFRAWAKARIGEAAYNILRQLSRIASTMTPDEKEALHKHFIGEKKRLLELRNKGMRGRIEFTSNYGRQTCTGEAVNA